LHLAAIELKGKGFSALRRGIKRTKGKEKGKENWGGSWLFSLKGKERVFRQRGERKHTLPGGNG
jgi:hypothetical protein